MNVILRWRVVYSVYNKRLHARQCAKAQTVFLIRYQHTSVYAEALVVYHVLFQWHKNLLFVFIFIFF